MRGPCGGVFAQNGAFSHIRIEPVFLSLTDAPIRRATATKDVNMTDTHSTKNSNESQQVRYAAPRSWIARTGSLIGVVMLAGLLAACGSGAPDVGAAAAAAPTHAQTRTVAERHFLFERLDHAGVNQRSTAHDSDLPGASIAVYGD